jgi:hypothetical protein
VYCRCRGSRQQIRVALETKITGLKNHLHYLVHIEKKQFIREKYFKPMVAFCKAYKVSRYNNSAQVI